MIHGINDSPEQAHELARILRPIHARVNLIPLSTVAEFEGRAPPAPVVREFLNILESARINATLRISKGGGVDAACGQLRRQMIQTTACPPYPLGEGGTTDD